SVGTFAEEHGGGDPLGPFKDSGLDAIPDDEQFVHGFEIAMRNVALDNLNKSEKTAEAKASAFGGAELGADRQVIRDVAVQVDKKDQELEPLLKQAEEIERTTDKTLPPAGAPEPGSSYEEKIAPLRAQIDQKQAEKQIVL